MSLDAEIQSFLESEPSKSGDSSPWIEATKSWVSKFGRDAVKDWHEKKTKHHHKLIQLAVSKDLVEYVGFAIKEISLFEVNTQRISDECTLLHLAVWFKKSERMLKMLDDLGADRTIKNKYGENCSKEYTNLINSYQNLIFLDLEMTSGFYSWANKENGDHNNPPKILEAAVIITDKDLNEKARGQWVVGGFSKEYLEALPEFHQKNFRDRKCEGADAQNDDQAEKKRKLDDGSAATSAPENGNAGSSSFPPLEKYGFAEGNGLFSDMINPSLAKPLEQVEKEMMLLLQKHCPRQACALAGNSIGCDREMLKLEMPKVYGYVSHRVVDVSTVLAGMISPWCPAVKSEWKLHQEESKANYNHRALNDCESAISSMKWIKKKFFDNVSLQQPSADQK
eukprot:TRINITY_DN7302_c0_g1_i1.p1 TRINITY_DN7302_c0_g1~~TRINITY_DN7302_c0_g1_i1.p1  ORF type:complete len:395 (-),score=98.31 TRINITY_DN7302_c0_g1_i1:114-1298(-)